MPSNSDKWIGSIKDNDAGKVVADQEGNRWEWQSDDPTFRLLKKLDNADLAIEKADLHPTDKHPRKLPRNAAPTPTARAAKPSARDAGGGFNPYDHSGRPKRR